ncbi:hypothetical protein CHU98_g5179 [Xylaria longipes]|nr:hypothetical protein CHU98_g5179 [Xylaria longipes]
MPGSLHTDVPTASGIEDKYIDLVKLASKANSIDKSKAKQNPREEIVILKPPKTPQVRLSFPHGFTTPEEEQFWEHELEFGFGNIWSANECIHVHAK